MRMKRALAVQAQVRSLRCETINGTASSVAPAVTFGFYLAIAQQFIWRTRLGQRFLSLA